MSELIVPVRDRRQRKRILTLKNFGRFAIAFAILFAGLTLRSEFRHGISDGYGRLFGKQVARQNDIAPPKFDVVKEAPVSDQTKADALLEDAAARSQYLTDPTATTSTTATTATAPAPVPAAVETAHVPNGSTNGATIVGDSNGVTIVRAGDQRRPVLSGGIFKQQ